MSGEMDHFWSENDASEYTWKLQPFMVSPKKLCKWLGKWFVLVPKMTHPHNSGYHAAENGSLIMLF